MKQTALFAALGETQSRIDYRATSPGSPRRSHLAHSKIFSMPRRSLEQTKPGGSSMSSSSRFSNTSQQVPFAVNTSFASSQLSSSQQQQYETGSLVNSETTSVSGKSLYRNDYSRSQHPLILPGGQQRKSAAPFNMENMSPEQIRFDKYVNRFAAHDPRSSPVRRHRDDSPLRNPSPLTISERISRFNGGGQQQQQAAPSPRPPARADNFGFPDPEPQLSSFSSGSADRKATSSPSGPQLSSFGSGSEGRKSTSFHPPTPQQQKQLNNGSMSTVTTVATNTTTERQQSPSVERRGVISRDVISTPSRYSRAAGRTLLTEGMRSYSYEHLPKNNDSAIETPSPAKVAELRSKLWDKGETLQVAFPPSFHYVGGRESSDADAEGVASQSGAEKKLPKGPEMAGRYGQRSRSPMATDRRYGHRSQSHSPKRPQYVNSAFKSRFYQAALASRRAPANNSSEQEHNVEIDRIEQERQQHEDPMQQQHQQQQQQQQAERQAPMQQQELEGQEEDLQQETQQQDYGRHQQQDYGRHQQQRQQQDHVPIHVQERQSQQHEAQRMHEQLIRTKVTVAASQRQRQRYEPRQVEDQLTTNATRMGQEPQSRQVLKTLPDTPTSANMWRKNPSQVDETSDGTGEASVAKLVARLNSISRDNPAAALAQIDSILRSESSSGDVEPSRTHLPVAQVQDEKKDDGDGFNDDEDSDDETSMSSITNPTYATGQLGTPNQQSMSGNRKPNALQSYTQPSTPREEQAKRNKQLSTTHEEQAKRNKQPSTAHEEQAKRHSKKDKSRPPPPATIDVKEPGSRGMNQSMGRLDQHVTSETREPTSAAAIAMKIRMWDEMSNSKASDKKDEAPSLQEELISAATEELGSIVTPYAGSLASSQHRESPMRTSMSPSSPATLLGPHFVSDSPERLYEENPESQPHVPALEIPSLDISRSQERLQGRGGPQERLQGLGGSQKRLQERGRQVSREESPLARPPRPLSNSITPRRRHPWDHKRSSILLNSKPSIVDTSMEGGEGVEMKPIAPAPVTSQRKVLQIRKEAVAKPDVVARGFTARDTPGFTGDAFEIDPKLLKSNDGFGFPAQIKQEARAPPSCSNDFDAAWEPSSASTFFPEKKTTSSRPSLAQRRLSGNNQRLPVAANSNDRNIVNSMSRAETVPFQCEYPVTEPQPVHKANVVEPPKSPGRSKFSLLKLKKSHDVLLKSPALDNSVPRDKYPASPKKQRDDGVNLVVEPPKSPGRSKFSLLKLRKSHDALLKSSPTSLDMNQTAETPQQSARSKSPGRRASPGRWASPGRQASSGIERGIERTGSFKIMKRFNRLRREKESEV